MTSPTWVCSRRQSLATLCCRAYLGTRGGRCCQIDCPPLYRYYCNSSKAVMPLCWGSRLSQSDRVARCDAVFTEEGLGGALLRCGGEQPVWEEQARQVVGARGAFGAPRRHELHVGHVRQAGRQADTPHGESSDSGLASPARCCWAYGTESSDAGRLSLCRYYGCGLGGAAVSTALPAIIAESHWDIPCEPVTRTGR